MNHYLPARFYRTMCMHLAFQKLLKNGFTHEAYEPVVHPNT